MNTAIVVPTKIKVGYQNRRDTYTKKLAYVIYYDNKGVLRKETSWEGWRDKKIDSDEFENIPTEGFVLNKKVGGDSSGWNHRQTYCRVYDPRGFEFEITMENLLYILENTNSIKGKGLEGNFVYGWSGKDILLIPELSPDYIEILNYNENLTKKVSKKDLVLGKVYVNKQNQRLVYLGYFEEYNTWPDAKKQYESRGKKFWFVNENIDLEQIYLSYTTYSSLSSILKEVGEVSSRYSEIMDRLEFEPSYSPYDPNQFFYEQDQTEKNYDKFINVDGNYVNVRISSTGYSYNPNRQYYLCEYKTVDTVDNNKFNTEEELKNHYTFYTQIKVLKNGKIAKR